MLLKDQDREQKSTANLRNPMETEADNGETSNKCSEAGTLQLHSEEKPNKCNQCDYASSQTTHLRTHLKTHSEEKPNKCNQCDFASTSVGKTDGR